MSFTMVWPGGGRVTVLLWGECWKWAFEKPCQVTRVVIS